MAVLTIVRVIVTCKTKEKFTADWDYIQKQLEEVVIKKLISEKLIIKLIKKLIDKLIKNLVRNWPRTQIGLEQENCKK